jgi:propionyl-CoA carboxylase alpha chain
MRIARSDGEARDGFRSAGNEARASFADDRIFIEKYIEEPRHIEIQVLGDAHGNIIHLGERECSIQRRHQKVVEEAPSPFLDEKTRAAMGAQAVALARAVGYRSAGTVEFIVDRKRNFYFLEMNTRLQVEHPVTEMVTGLDLVELMILIAAGEKLPMAQKDIRLHGSAIEARIYAEDPVRNFLPSVGRLVHYRPPTGDGIRVDSGVYEGAEIGIQYDPMIAKLVAYGETRELATARLGAALDAFYIRGLSHNVGFLAAVLAKERFAAGRLSTDFIAEEFPDGYSGSAAPAVKAQAIAVAAAMRLVIAERETWNAASKRPLPEEWVVCLGAEQYPVRTVRCKGTITVAREGERHTVVTTWQPGKALLDATVDGTPLVFQVDRDGIGWRLTRGGASLPVKMLTPRAAELLALMPAKPPPDLSRFLLSPMPGLLVSIAVVEGQEVKAGEELAVVEAMKMENVLRAERDGRVAKVSAKPGDNLAVDQVILEFA